MDKVERLDLEELARSRGILVLRAPVSTFLGAAMIVDGEAAICLAENQLPHRYRFSFAHELGHVCIPWHYSFLSGGRRLVDHDISERDPSTQKEREANEFAAELLIPEALLKPLLEIGSIDVKRALGVSEAFDVSPTSAALRVAKVSREPVAVLFFQENRLQWGLALNNFPYGVPLKNWEAPNGSATADALNGAHDVSEALEVDPRIWLVNRQYGGYPALLESSYRLGRTGFILTMLWAPK